MKTVLIVEDEYAIAQVLQMLLEGEGYRVLVAGEGREALTLLEREPVDLIISDVMMPGMSGLDLCRALAASPRHQQLPIVLMSALGRTAVNGHCPYSAFLTKPFELDSVSRLVEHLLAAPGGP